MWVPVTQSNTTVSPKLIVKEDGVKLKLVTVTTFFVALAEKEKIVRLKTQNKIALESIVLNWVIENV